MKNSQLVSVVLPVYNCETFLEDSIKSILNQTYTNLELIIINDASTDNTKNIIKEFLNIDSRIRYFENNINSGVSFSTNLGILKSNGIYIAKQDADDISLNTRIESQVRFFSQNPDIDLLTGKAIFFNNGNAKEWISGESLNQTQIKFKLFLCCPIMNPTLMIKKSFITKNHLLYDLAFNGPEDYDFFTKAILLGKIYSFSDILIKYRIHDSDTRLNHRSKVQRYKLDTLKIRENYFKANSIFISDMLLYHYESLFYGDITISIFSLKKTILFYKKFKAAFQKNHLSNIDAKYVNNEISKSLYNSLFQYSRVGVIAYLYYLKYAKQFGRFDFKKEFKFFIKCLLAI